MTACGKCGQVHKPTIGGRPCKGHKKSYLDAAGERVFYPEAERPPCTRAAMLGQDVCHSHGGATKQNRAAGKARETERKAQTMAARLAIPIKVSATEALIGQIEVWAGLEAFYAQKVYEVRHAGGDDALVWGITKDKTGGDDAGTTREAAPNVWVSLHERASDRLTKFSVEALRIGIEERRVRMAQQHGDQVADVIRQTADAILGALRSAGLTDGLAEVFNAALVEAAPRHLRLLTG